MDAKKYAEAYESSQEFKIAERQEVADIMSEPRRYEQLFSEFLIHYLSNGTMEGLRSEFESFLQEYARWAGSIGLYEKAINRGDFSDKEFAEMTVELNFHRINYGLIANWSRLDPSLKGDPIFFRERTNVLSYCGVRMVGAMEELKMSGDRILRVNAMIGCINEIDAAISSSEAFTRDPHIIVLPAPAQFDNGTTTSINSDLIVIDLRAHEARSIQVKSSVTNGKVRRYDTDFVTVIDADTDLGNSTMVKQGRSYKRQSKPGLISAAHLKRVNKTPAKNLSKKSIAALINTKLEAGRILGSYKPYDTIAASALRRRLQHDLYKQPAPQISEETA